MLVVGIWDINGGNGTWRVSWCRVGKIVAAWGYYIKGQDPQCICKSGGTKNLFFPSVPSVRHHYVCHERNNFFLACLKVKNRFLVFVESKCHGNSIFLVLKVFCFA